MTPGLYVHVPFCRSKCGYCDFYSVTGGDAVDRWLELLPVEARLVGGGFSEFDTLHVGGGTPSSLGPARLTRLLATLRAVLPVAADAEVTVELNPDDVDGPLAETLAGAGVKRLSVGVQSFDDGALRLLGRRHDAARCDEALATLRRAVPAALGVDLIFGWPGQTAAALRADLDRALAWGPEHVSCYELTLEGDTPLHREACAGRLRLPDEERQRELFLAASDHLARHGFEHYEVSNHARGRRHRSRHNAKYWSHTPYLGLGPAAHSFDGRRRWWNGRDVAAHLGRLAAGAPPEVGSEALDAEQLGLEALMLGLRTADGVATDVLDGLDGWRAAAEPLVAEGLLRLEAGRVCPTREGLLHADGLARSLACRR